jgi:hypothetical protein
VKKKAPLPKQYGAPPGSKREALLRKAAKMYKSGNKKGAFALRNKMEAVNARKKKAKK